jgi:hypothetical protein
LPREYSCPPAFPAHWRRRGCGLAACAVPLRRRGWSTHPGPCRRAIPHGWSETYPSEIGSPCRLTEGNSERGRSDQGAFKQKPLLHVPPGPDRVLVQQGANSRHHGTAKRLLERLHQIVPVLRRDVEAARFVSETFHIKDALRAGPTEAPKLIADDMNG